MTFAYVLECMFLALISTAGGTNSPLITTGEKPTNKDVIVSLVGWLVVYLIISFIILIVRIIRGQIRIRLGEPEKEPKEESLDTVCEKIYNNKLSKCFLYFFECASLSFLYNHNDKKLVSTGNKATKKEYLNFVWIWLTMAVAITVVVLLCVYF